MLNGKKLKRTYFSSSTLEIINVSIVNSLLKIKLNVK